MRLAVLGRPRLAEPATVDPALHRLQRLISLSGCGSGGLAIPHKEAEVQDRDPTEAAGFAT